VTILDANILLYAHNGDDPRHRPVGKWVEDLLSKGDITGLPWPTIWAFLRVSTNERIWKTPLTPAEAFETIQGWLAQPRVLVVQPGPRHVQILEQVVTESRSIGTRLSDAVLAALAIEHGATLASTDRDFARFSGLRWINPLP
jgi:toxin-antitoxin system PIN domain toxin